MTNSLNFTQISAGLLNNNKPEIIKLLQDNGVLISSNASDSQVRKAYLISIADSPVFRQKLNDFVFSGSHSADGGLTYGANLSPNYGLTLSNDTNPLEGFQTPNLSFLNTPASASPIAPAPTASGSTGGSSFLSGIGKVLSSPQFAIVLDSAANAFNTSNALKEQDNQIKEQQLQYANNAQLLQNGINPGGITSKTGLSTGAKIGIFVGILVVIAGVIMAINHSKKAGVGRARVISSGREQKLLK